MLTSKQMASMGGKAASAKLSKKQRTARAKRAAEARWKKKKVAA